MVKTQSRNHIDCWAGMSCWGVGKGVTVAFGVWRWWVLPQEEMESSLTFPLLVIIWRNGEDRRWWWVPRGAPPSVRGPGRRGRGPRAVPHGSLDAPERGGLCAQQHAAQISGRKNREWQAHLRNRWRNYLRWSRCTHINWVPKHLHSLSSSSSKCIPTCSASPCSISCDWDSDFKAQQNVFPQNLERTRNTTGFWTDDYRRVHYREWSIHINCLCNILSTKEYTHRVRFNK